MNNALVTAELAHADMVRQCNNYDFELDDDMADAAADVFHPEIYRPGLIGPARFADQTDPGADWHTLEDDFFENDGYQIAVTPRQQDEGNLPYDIRTLMGL